MIRISLVIVLVYKLYKYFEIDDFFFLLGNLWKKIRLESDRRFFFNDRPEKRKAENSRWAIYTIIKLYVMHFG